MRLRTALGILLAGLASLAPVAAQSASRKKGPPKPAVAVAPHPAASHVIQGPYLQSPSETGILICWVTPAACRGEVRYGPGRDLKLKAADPGDAVYHQIRLDGLTPDTAYAYQVVDGDYKSDTLSFRTFPSKGDGPFTFIAYGDTRSGHDTHRKIVQALAQRDAAFAVHTGDLVVRGSDPDLWQTFFDINREFMARTPVYFVQGNHEHGASLYFDHLALPGNEKWFSFRYANALFIGLDSSPGPRTSKEQMEFLRSALKDNADADYVFPFFHHAIFSATTMPDRQKDTKLMYDAWGKIFEEAKVAVAFGGHNHNYQRAEKNGVQYVTSGGGGAELYALGPKLPETKIMLRTHHYIVVSVRGKTARYETYDLDGKVIDQIELKARK